MIENYLISKRKKISFILIDVRRGIEKEEEQMIEWLTFHKIPYHIIFTKSDKIGRNLLREQQKKFKDSIFTSSHLKEGIEDIWKKIEKDLK